MEITRRNLADNKKKKKEKTGVTEEKARTGYNVFIQDKILYWEFKKG